MGLKECQIVLDNPWNTYYAGQILNGHVDFTFDKPKKIRGKYSLFHSMYIIYMHTYVRISDGKISKL